MAIGAGRDPAGRELIRALALGLALSPLLLLFPPGEALAAAPAPRLEAEKPWESDAGLLAMARLQPGLQRNHVALYFGGAVTGQGLGLPGPQALNAALGRKGDLELTFRLPAVPEPLRLTVPQRGVGYYPVGPGGPVRAEFARAEGLEGYLHFERFDAEALSGWFFLRMRSPEGDTLQTFGGAFREVSP